jgi:hypothetical protein
MLNENICIFLPLGLQFLHFLKQIFGYTALHYAVDRLNLQRTVLTSYVYVDTTTRPLRGPLRRPNAHEVPPWLAPSVKILRILRL